MFTSPSVMGIFGPTKWKVINNECVTFPLDALILVDFVSSASCFVSGLFLSCTGCLTAVLNSNQWPDIRPGLCICSLSLSVNSCSFLRVPSLSGVFSLVFASLGSLVDSLFDSLSKNEWKEMLSWQKENWAAESGWASFALLKLLLPIMTPNFLSKRKPVQNIGVSMTLCASFYDGV